MERAPDKKPTADIIIVDDAPENLDILIEILSDTPYTVRPATNAESALKAAAVRPPDLVLADIHLPGMNGFALCEKLKRDVRLKDTPVIFISGSTGADVVRYVYAAGGADYIVKPFQSEEVLSRVKNHLELRLLRRELERYRAAFGVIDT